jgi:3-oxoacyl-[acyl-carrier protein] reductase
MQSNTNHNKLADRRVALVTGAAGALGRAICQELHEHNCFIIITYNTRRDEALRLGEQMRHSLVFHLDITNQKDVHEIMKQIGNEVGRLDILVNNAGVLSGSVGPLEELTESQWRNMLDVNVIGAVRVTAAALPLLRTSPAPRIINIASVHAISGGRPGLSIYTTAKAALIGFTKAASRELAPHITVNAVAPGFVGEGMTESLNAEIREAALKLIPMRRFARAREVGSAVAFLAAEDAAYITGHTLVVGGGRIDLDMGIRSG